MNKPRFSPQTENYLQRAGWFPSRQALRKVKLAKAFELFPAAETVLNEFGGLIIGEQKKGIDYAKVKFETELTVAVQP